MMGHNIKNLNMKNPFLICILSFILVNCEDVALERTIEKNDYYVEYANDNSEIYRLNDKTKMSGVFMVTSGNQLKESFSVDDGLLFDAYKTYHANGMVATESIYLKGLKNGPEKFFYPSGKLKTKNSYRNGEKIKSSISYYEDGAIQNRTNSKGNTEYFHKNGTMYSESNADQNKLFKDGKLSIEEYEHEHKTGLISVVKSYKEDGSISKIIGFRMDGEMTSEENIFLLILDENHNITDSVNPKQNVQEFIKVIQELGPELANELSNW